jgi:GTP pyrophosphokinase
MRKHQDNNPENTGRFPEALVMAHDLHAKQVRKGTPIPYFAHLMSVAALVMEAGGDEDEAIAALLHDAVEDQGGLATLREIRDRFGDRVAAIVEGCTDATSTPKPPWRQRKEAYLAHLNHASQSVRRVSLADKLHNARTILRDLRLNGPEIWNRFRGGRDGSLWYYRQLADFFSAEHLSPQAAELAEIVAEIERLAVKTAGESL